MIIKLNEKKLREDTVGETTDKLISSAKKELDVDNSSVYSGEGIIESALDKSLRVATRMKKYGGRDYPNILFVGEAGTGKTSRIRAWANKHNINLFEVRAAGMDDTDLGGAIVPVNGVSQRLASVEFDDLNDKDSVLFLDEYNRAPKSVRTNLLELVNSHVVPDPRVHGKQRKLENFLFTVAAINPPSVDYDVDEMDAAERSRFRSIHVPAEKITTKNFYISEINRLLSDKSLEAEYRLELERKKNLVNAILTNKRFQFDNAKTTSEMNQNHFGEIVSPTNSRTFYALLKMCDGTKEDFIDLWNDYCNPDQKDLIRTILANYEDVKDKATDVLSNHDTESTVFKKKTSGLSKLKKFLGEE